MRYKKQPSPNPIPRLWCYSYWPWQRERKEAKTVTGFPHGWSGSWSRILVPFQPDKVLKSPANGEIGSYHLLLHCTTLCVWQSCHQGLRSSLLPLIPLRTFPWWVSTDTQAIWPEKHCLEGTTQTPPVGSQTSLQRASSTSTLPSSSSNPHPHWNRRTTAEWIALLKAPLIAQSLPASPCGRGLC